MRASCWVMVLPPSTVPGSRTLRTTARATRDRIDAGMQEEAVVLDRDERVLQVRRDRGERHVVPLLVEAEPRPAVGGVEPGVADAAGQLVDGVALLAEPPDAERGDSDHHVEQEPGAAQVGAQQSEHTELDAGGTSPVRLTPGSEAPPR